MVRDYQAAMRLMDQSNFSVGSFDAYVYTRVFAEGLERAGRDLTRSRLRPALKGVQRLDLGGFSVNYTDSTPLVVRLAALSPQGLHRLAALLLDNGRRGRCSHCTCIHHLRSGLRGGRRRLGNARRAHLYENHRFMKPFTTITTSNLTAKIL